MKKNKKANHGGSVPKLEVLLSTFGPLIFGLVDFSTFTYAWLTWGYGDLHDLALRSVSEAMWRARMLSVW